MTDPWRILVVDDDASIAKTTAELFDISSNVEAKATSEKSFEESLVTISDGKFDILVLDVRDQRLVNDLALPDADADPGLNIFRAIRSQKFLPVVFYTALPDLVEPLSNPPFVQIVSKLQDNDIAELRNAITMIIDSGLLNIIRALDRHVETVIRDFMANFVEDNWVTFDDHKADLAYLLLRRLGVSLERGTEPFFHELGPFSDLESGEDGEDDVVHATRCYVVPPVEGYRMGDILSGPDMLHQNISNPTDSWYIILTPSCDLVGDRVKAKRDNEKYVVLAECLYLRNFREYKDWQDSNLSNTKKQELMRLLRSRPSGRQEDRYHYLPKAWHVPDLVVDLQRIIHISNDQLGMYVKVASLDSPFSEALSNRFNRYMGRVGTPDLDLDAALDRMREAD